MKSLFITMLALLFAFGANAEVKKAVYTVNPKMSCQNCENKIKSNLRFEKGVKNIETSLDAQTVTVTYDDTKTTPEKITAGLKKIGYAATPATAATTAATKKCDGKCQKAEGCCKDKAAAAKKCDGKCAGDKKCDGKCQKAEGCCKDKAVAAKKCDGKCAADKKCDGKCAADKKCDGKCAADKKCDGKCQKTK